MKRMGAILLLFRINTTRGVRKHDTWPHKHTDPPPLPGTNFMDTERRPMTLLAEYDDEVFIKQEYFDTPRSRFCKGVYP